jgi:hypothetical protein
MVLPLFLSAVGGADIATEGETSSNIEKEIIKTKEAVIQFFEPKPEFNCTLVSGASVETWLCQEK